MIYFIQDSSTLLIKIGYTGASDAESRLKQLQTGCPSGLELLCTSEGTQADERELHERFKTFRERGEWFKPAPQVIRHLCLLAESCGRRDQAMLTKQKAIIADPNRDALVNFVSRRFEEKTGVDLRKDQMCLVRTQEACERALHDLCCQGKANINLPFIWNSEHLEVTIWRAQINQMEFSARPND